MKNKILYLIILMLTIVVFPIKTYATELNNVDINVELQDNGDAVITSKWNYYDDDKTEHYIIIEDLEDSEIKDYSVLFNGKPMEYEEDWDVDGSFEEKAGKYGIVKTGKGYELCYGKTEYANNEFTVKYTITNYIKELKDAQMLYWTFIKELSEPPKEVSVTISSDKYNINKDNAKIWFFGCTGNIEFKDGKIEMKSLKSLNKSEYLTILTRFNFGMFETTSVIDKDFEYYKDMGFKGSYYEKESKVIGFFKSTLGIASLILIALGVILLIVFLLKKWKEHVHSDEFEGWKDDRLNIDKKQYRRDEYFREVPYNGDIGDLYVILERNWTNTMENYISAYLLKWIKEGKIEAVKEEKGLLFKKESVSFKIFEQRAIDSTDFVEKYFYEIMLEASEGDGVLDEKDFKNWAKKNYEKLERKLEEFKNRSKSKLRKDGYLEIKIQVNKYTKYITTTYSEEGRELWGNLVKFEHYLKDYSMLNSRDSYNVHIWDDFMIYAALFGITEEVKKEFENIYPSYSNETNYDLATIYYVNSFSRGFSSSYSSSFSSSSSGGGGFSSGGGGGGSFGGGGGGSR